jgi:hypothetical protein
MTAYPRFGERTAQPEIVSVARTRPLGELLYMRGRDDRKEALLFFKKEAKNF